MLPNILQQFKTWSFASATEFLLHQLKAFTLIKHITWLMRDQHALQTYGSLQFIIGCADIIQLSILNSPAADDSYHLSQRDR